MTPPVVHLHVGTLKSGTSYLQAALWQLRGQLAEAGILFPGEHRWSEQVEAVRDLLTEERRTRRPIDVGAWDAMCRDILAWDGHAAVVSMELLSLASDDRVERAVAALRPAEVRVVITVRDLARVMPSSWQESVQNRQTWTWDEYVAGLTGQPGADDRAGERFWKQQDVPSLARRWAAVVGHDQVTLVVVPPSGTPRDTLWRRFAPVVGIDPDVFVVADDIRGNPAMGAASAEFVRRVNVRLGKRFDIPTYEQHVKRFLAKDTLSHRGEARLQLPVEHRAWASERATELVAELRAAAYRVEGNLDELLPIETATHEPDVGAVADSIAQDAAVADAGVQAVEAIVRQLAGHPAPTSGDRPAGRRRGRGRRRPVG